MWTSLVPLPYRIAIIAALFAAATGFGWVKGAAHNEAKHEAADTARIHAEDAAINARVQSNTAMALQQRDVSNAIEKANHEELAPVLSAIATDRVRVGPALCGGSSPATQAESASSGNVPDPVASAVREQAERDLAALKEEVAESLAAGRSCQSWVSANGFAP